MNAPREWFEKDYYRILGVDQKADAKEITRAYRKLARENHPDTNPDDPAAEERFKAVSTAYDVVGDATKRKEYDEVRALGPMGGFGSSGAGGPGGGFGGPGGPGGYTFDMGGNGGLGDDASPAAAVAAPSNDRLGPTRLQRTSAIVATIGVAVALIGLVTMLRPVQTPLQDCGTTLTFLLDGRVNEFGDPNDPPKGLTADEVTANNDRPCRVRVGARAKPAGVLIAGGVVAAVGAGATEITARMVAWRRRVRDRTRPGHPLAPRG